MADFLLTSQHLLIPVILCSEPQKASCIKKQICRHQGEKFCYVIFQNNSCSQITRKSNILSETGKKYWDIEKFLYTVFHRLKLRSHSREPLVNLKSTIIIIQKQWLATVYRGFTKFMQKYSLDILCFLSSQLLS